MLRFSAEKLHRFSLTAATNRSFLPMPHTIALILAGGTGSRFGSARPKQFTLVAGRTVLEHSIAAFEQSEEIDEIGIVVHPKHLDEVRDLLRQQPHPKVTQVVAGGKERERAQLRRQTARFAPLPTCLREKAHKPRKKVPYFPLKTVNFLQKLHNFLQTIHKVLRQTVNTPTTTLYFL